MGGKRTGKGKQIHFCIAILILLCLWACTLSKTADTTMLGIKISDPKADEVREHLLLGRKYFSQGNYTAALKEHEMVISLAGAAPPADESLFSVAVIQAHPANPARDAGKAILSCRKLIKDYPQSFFAEQAKTLIAILQENDKLSRTVERLNTIIEESKKVDVEIEQRKRGKVK